MTPDQEEHVKRIITKFSSLIDGKYRNGQREHGGDLWKKDGLLDMAIEEVVDLSTYLLTLKESLTSPRHTFGQILNWDMDATLCQGVAWTIEDVSLVEPKKENISKLNEQSKRHYIIIHTARRDELIPATLEWLRRNNVRYHAISNQKSPGLYIDEDAVRPSEV